MLDAVLVPGERDVRASLDRGGDGSDAVVVACPPHPEHGGRRHDARLTAISEALVGVGINCLRFDYGSWDEGRGERVDANHAVEWAHERYDRVGLFGYSFGATVALLTATEARVDAISALAPTASLAPDRDGVDTPDLDAVSALDAIDAPVQIVYGTRDSTVEWEPVVERARKLGHRTDDLAADHFFVGQHGTVADQVLAFLGDVLAE